MTPTDTTQPAPIAPPQSPPNERAAARARSLANLVRYEKGHAPAHLPKGRKGPNAKTLESEVRRVLKERSYEKTRALAVSIVSRAIKGEPAALAFLGPRLWPILEESARSQKVISQGIRLELPGGAVVSLAQSSSGEQGHQTSPLIDVSHQVPTDDAQPHAPSEAGDPPSPMEGDVVRRE